MLHPTAGFIQLGLLLERLEAEASTPLSQQTGWNELRLGKARGWDNKAIHKIG